MEVHLQWNVTHLPVTVRMSPCLFPLAPKSCLFSMIAILGNLRYAYIPPKKGNPHPAQPSPTPLTLSLHDGLHPQIRRVRRIVPSRKTAFSSRSLPVFFRRLSPTAVPGRPESHRFNFRNSPRAETLINTTIFNWPQHRVELSPLSLGRIVPLPFFPFGAPLCPVFRPLVSSSP